MKLVDEDLAAVTEIHCGFQSPRGDFGFLKLRDLIVEIVKEDDRFNPLAGILVF